MNKLFDKYKFNHVITILSIIDLQDSTTSMIIHKSKFSQCNVWNICEKAVEAGLITKAKKGNVNIYKTTAKSSNLIGHLFSSGYNFFH